MDSSSASSFREHHVGSWSDVVLIIGMGLISVVTIFGNIVVILSYYLDRNIRQPSNYFIFSLAVSDLLIGLEGIPVYTHFFLHNQKWRFGWFLCDLWLSIDYSCCLASIYTVLGITVDRYCSVKYPAAYRNWRTPTKVLLIIALTWIIPSVLFSVSIFGYGSITGRGRLLKDDECYVQFMTDAYLNMGMYIAYYWSTLGVMLVLYYGIYRAAKQLASKNEQKNRRIQMLSKMANRVPGGAPPPPLSSALSRDAVSAVLTSEVAPSSSVADDTSDSLHSRSNMLTPAAGSSSHKLSRLEGAPESSGGPGSEPESVAFHVVDDDLPYIDDDRDEHVAIHRRLGTIRNSQKHHLHALNNAAPLLNNGHSQHNHVTLQTAKRNGLDDCEQVRVPLLTVSRVERHRPAAEESNVRRILTVMRSRSGRRRKRKPNDYKSKSENRARKALRTITVILGTFTVLWTPFYVLATIYGFCERCKNSENFNLLYSISYYLCYMNSPVNPLCYAFANAQFKKTFKRILHGDLHRT
ncbi:hypothetical protein QR680_013129 [Steinernema hermaphroditum]|uniref:G-protein coupled receptors family 1 profile domain-containing protein n=1 Tax=Steinernema hermaphroditum TaxID=289476 RepID=A0AA39I4G7_9BILA|nr:hypothetical protein QR680_013129 [Steinernema hermaphroditum]